MIKDFVLNDTITAFLSVRKKDIRAVADMAEKGKGDLFYGLRQEVLK